MPSPSEILSGLAQMADRSIGLAIAWHVVVLIVLIVALAGWRPSRREAGLLVATPIATASLLAWAYGNPFNGALLAGVVAVLIVRAVQAPVGPVVAPGPAAAALGGAMLAFALIYPHFLDGRAPLAYLYAAPVGLIPCPSLSLAIGATLLFAAPTGRAAAITLGAAGLFYGLFGALRLGVWLDLALIAGAAGLLVIAHAPRHGARPAHPLRPAHAAR